MRGCRHVAILLALFAGFSPKHLALAADTPTQTPNATPAPAENAADASPAPLPPVNVTTQTPTKSATRKKKVVAESASISGEHPDDVRKLNGMLRYTQGSARDGISVTGMAYTNKWNSTDQIPERAIATGQTGLYGAEDSSDGGSASRHPLSVRIAKSDDIGSWKANAYLIKSELDLFNNFTYFLTGVLMCVGLLVACLSCVPKPTS